MCRIGGCLNGGKSSEFVLLSEPRNNYYECVECEKEYPEQELQLCRSCSRGLDFNGDEVVTRYVLCAGCAIRNHIREEHEVVDFCKYLREYNFLARSSRMNEKMIDLQRIKKKLITSFAEFNDLSLNVSQTYDVLTDMARRRNSITTQNEFFKKIEKLIDEMESIHEEADIDMKKHSDKLKSTLAKFNQWCEQRKEDPVKEPEIMELPNSGDIAHFDEKHSNMLKNLQLNMEQWKEDSVDDSEDIDEEESENIDEEDSEDIDEEDSEDIDEEDSGDIDEEID